MLDKKNEFMSNHESRLALIRELAELCNHMKCSIQYEASDFSISINFNNNQDYTGQQQQSPAISCQPSVATAPTMPTIAAAPVMQQKSGIVVKSDLVGTVYLAPAPDKDVFVKIGSHVNKGDTICIIDCMKVMNPIEATHTGEIVHIHVGNGEVIEFGQPLFTIREVA